eukprot:snap_masked-scaffold_19-processed-gene-2.5-mRNA-1 protein AED:1.00 eAED:1.00 QI:0/0/0/0/1/1/2/0/258
MAQTLNYESFKQLYEEYESLLKNRNQRETKEKIYEEDIKVLRDYILPEITSQKKKRSTVIANEERKRKSKGKKRKWIKKSNVVVSPNIIIMEYLAEKGFFPREVSNTMQGKRERIESQYKTIKRRFLERNGGSESQIFQTKKMSLREVDKLILKKLRLRCEVVNMEGYDDKFVQERVRFLKKFVARGGVEYRPMLRKTYLMRKEWREKEDRVLLACLRNLYSFERIRKVFRDRVDDEIKVRMLKLRRRAAKVGIFDIM